MHRILEYATTDRPVNIIMHLVYVLVSTIYFAYGAVVGRKKYNMPFIIGLF